MENNKTKIRKVLETIEHEIHVSWLRDLDKTNELQELIKILEDILNCKSIEEYFENIETDFDYFIKKFSKENINNILRQHYIYGENGDEIASNILLLYLKLFLKFHHFNNYIPLWESVKEIFDSSKPYYKGMGFNMNSKIDQNKRFKKQMSAESFNVIIYIKMFFICYAYEDVKKKFFALCIMLQLLVFLCLFKFIFNAFQLFEDYKILIISDKIKLFDRKQNKCFL